MRNTEDTYIHPSEFYVATKNPWDADWLCSTTPLFRYNCIYIRFWNFTCMISLHHNWSYVEYFFIFLLRLSQYSHEQQQPRLTIVEWYIMHYKNMWCIYYIHLVQPKIIYILIYCVQKYTSTFHYVSYLTYVVIFYISVIS